METNIQPTFIPRKPLSSPTPAPQKPQYSINFFSLIATVAFITSLVLSGAVYGYQKYLESQLTTKNDALQQQLSNFDPKLVAELSRLDNRIESVNELVKNHIILSPIFHTIGAMTLQSVRFTGMTYTGARRGIDMGGVAKSYMSVALQSLEFAKPENQKYIKDSVVSDPTVDASGNITFRYKGTLVPSMFRYTDWLASSTASTGTPVINFVAASTTRGTVASSTQPNQ